MALLLLLLLTLVIAHGAQQPPQQMSFAERLAARNISASAMLGATPLNNACGGSKTWNLGSMAPPSGQGGIVYVGVGCTNSAVRTAALYDAQNVQYTLTPNMGTLGYDDYLVFVVPTCATDAATLDAVTPLNGYDGDLITKPFTSTTYTCSSQECCLLVICANSPGFTCTRGSLNTSFTLRTNAGVVAGIVISALAVVVIAVVCVMRARRKAAAGNTYNAAPDVVVYNAAAAPGAPPPTYQQPYQQPAFMQPQQQYQPQQYQQPPPQYQQQQYQQPPPQQWR